MYAVVRREQDESGKRLCVLDVRPVATPGLLEEWDGNLQLWEVQSEDLGGAAAELETVSQGCPVVFSYGLRSW